MILFVESKISNIIDDKRVAISIKDHILEAIETLGEEIEGTVASPFLGYG